MLYHNKTKIYKRLLNIVIIAIILCTILCSGAVYFYLKPFVEHSLLEKNRNMILKMAEEVSNSLEEIAMYEQNIAFDDTVQNALLRGMRAEKGSYRYFSSILELEKKLKEYRILRDNLILDIFAVDTQGKILETSYQYEELKEQDLYKDIFSQQTTGLFLPAHMVDYHGSYGKKDTIAYVNEIYDKEKYKVKIGKLVILMDAEQMATPLAFDEQEVKLELHNQAGEIMYTNTNMQLEGNLEETKYYRDPTGKKGWYLCYQITTQDITDTITRMNTIVMGIMVLSLLFMLTLVVGLVKKIVGPLETLIQGMQRVADGSREERIEIHTDDELETAANIFNTMVTNINHSTKELLQSEKRQYDSQLKMLSYQLNPHFIYNTLNAVICLARKQNYEEIIHLTRSFIAILQSILHTNLQALTSIEQEKRFIDRYVEVLQICYKNIPNIQWTISEGLSEQQIPGLILYPLVENSIFHGIIPSEHASLLKITITQKGNWIEVLVEDDGVGCTEQELAGIQERLHQEKTAGHVGLYNVNGRLKLIYKEVRLLEIEQREEKGTKIFFAYCIE